MTQTICLFEDNKVEDFLPLVYFRPVYDLRCGILTLREKLETYLSPAQTILHCRSFLTDVVKQNNPTLHVNSLPEDDILFINGRLIADKTIASQINALSTGTFLVNDEQYVVAAKLPADKTQIFYSQLPLLEDISSIPGIKIEKSGATLANYPWDLFSVNGEQIKEDCKTLTSGIKERISGTVMENVSMINKDEIHIGNGSIVEPFVLLDATDGPIYIGENAKVMSHSTIQGPCFIGDNSVIKIGAKIYHETSIGPVCKVGGEIENCIIHSYSNKQHDGFLGHSYLGSWVNLGADTNNSDLKNNYDLIKLIINGKKVNTGLQFVGLIMGDHSKTAIGSLFNTGTIAGCGCNIFGSGFPRTYIPSFSWGGAKGFVTYKLEKCLEVAKKVMSRRKIEMTEVDEKLFANVFEMTSKERKF